jgi:predicted regulator of Ras-like GTPase activity (Roadblock/LC7/MglB family)
MTPFSSRARELEERLHELALRVGQLRGLLLVDSEGLPLVSTLRSAGLEERLSAFGGSAIGLLGRARDDFQMGPQHLLHVAGRDRQIFLVPVADGVALMGIAESGASAPAVQIHLLALAREILELILTPPQPSGLSPAAGADERTRA